MTPVADGHLYPILFLPSKLMVKIREWIYGYVRLLLSMICSVSCLFCVFTFIWYLTFRGLYGFLTNLQLYQSSDCDDDDDDRDLDIDYKQYKSGKRKSFLTRCRAQAELLQQTLRKNKSTRDKSSNGVSPKAGGDVSAPQENGNSNLSHSNHSNSNHGVHIKNSSYVLEAYYDDKGHKIGEQIYLTNDSDGLEESYFQFKVNDVHHLKDLGGLSTSALVEEEPLDEIQPEEDNDAHHINVITANSPHRRKISCLLSQHPESTSSTCSIYSGDSGDIEDDRSINSLIGNSRSRKRSKINDFFIAPEQYGNEENFSYNNKADSTCSTITIESIAGEKETKETISVIASNQAAPSIIEKASPMNKVNNKVQSDGVQPNAVNKHNTNGKTNYVNNTKQETINEPTIKSSSKKPRKKRRNNSNKNRSNNS